MKLLINYNRTSISVCSSLCDLLLTMQRSQKLVSNDTFGIRGLYHWFITAKMQLVVRGSSLSTNMKPEKLGSDGKKKIPSAYRWMQAWWRGWNNLSRPRDWKGFGVNWGEWGMLLCMMQCRLSFLLKLACRFCSS